jgi:serine/threonine protein kinase
MSLQPGTLLQGGKYEILRALGQGGFGITYEAEHKLFGRKVAVKEFFMKEVCSPELAAQFLTKFIKEARILANLDHPHIVRVTDVFEENDTAYYVMDYLPGGSLADRMKKDGPFSEARAEVFIRQIADALAYVHSMNMVHLDVKPANILLNAKGEAVLIDFGISKHYDKSGEQTSSTPIGVSKGYAPLEQGRGGDVSQFKPSTDVYSLGATFYHLVTGFPPPEASIVNEDGLEQPQGTSDRCWNAIRLAMQPRRKDRPQSMQAFLALLDGGGEEEGTVLLQTTAPVKEPMVAKTPEPVHAPTPAPASVVKERPRASKKGLVAGLVGGAVVAAVVLGILLFRNPGGPSEDLPVVPQDSLLVENLAPAPSPVVQTTAPEKKPKATTKETPKETTKETPKDASKETPQEAPKESQASQVQEQPVQEAVAKSAEPVSQPQAKPQPEPEPEPAAPPTRGKVNGHEWVDLGLSVQWASCNLGASSPSAATKEDFSKNTYSVSASKTKLSLTDDAAAKSWGGTWRMPTAKEMTELREKCKWTWTTQGGKNGYKVTSKITGNSIFLPATGQMNGSMLVFEDDLGYYWTSVSDFAKTANNLFFSSGQVSEGTELREYGYPIRPVIKAL